MVFVRSMRARRSLGLAILKESRNETTGIFGILGDMSSVRKDRDLYLCLNSIVDFFLVGFVANDENLLSIVLSCSVSYWVRGGWVNVTEQYLLLLPEYIQLHLLPE